MGDWIDILRHACFRIEGAVSVEDSAAGLRPWRLPHMDIALFSPGVATRAGQPSGVRFVFRSNTPAIRIAVQIPKNADGSAMADASWTWDLRADGALACRVSQSCAEEEIRLAIPEPFGPRQERVLEVWLPSQYLPVTLASVCINADAGCSTVEDRRRRFVMYGSSITQAKEAAGPSDTWAAIAAARNGLYLTNLGFGGQEHAEGGIARVIRDLPADVIGLCLGGNIHANSSLSARTYLPAVIDMVRIIREKHPRTPIALFGCIYMPEEVGQKNLFGLTLDEYRAWTREAADKLRAHGDGPIRYIHGPDLYGPDDAAQFTHDGAHPDAEGQRLLGLRIAERVLPMLLSDA